jgi:hypothetical protein
MADQDKKIKFPPHASRQGRQRLVSPEGSSNNIPEPYGSAHKHCFRNRREILASDSCGCFHCGSIFGPSEIWEWHDEGETAFCPRCSIDALIGTASGLKIDREFLFEMNRHWFGFGFVEPLFGKTDC